MPATDRYQLIVESATRGESELRRFEQTMNRLTDVVERGQKKTADASRRSEENLRRFAANVGNAVRNPLQTAGAAVESFIGTFGRLGPVAIAASVGLGIATKRVLDLGKAAEQMANLADQTGLSVAQVDRLKAVASVTNTDLNVLAQSTKALVAFLGETSPAADKARTALRGLGVSIFTATGAQRELGDIQEQLLQKLGAVRNQTELVRLATELLGKSGTALLPLIRNYTEVNRAAQELGFGLDEGLIRRLSRLDDQVDLLALKWQRLERQLLKPIIGFVEIVVGAANAPTRGRQVGTVDPRSQRSITGAVTHGGLPADPFAAISEFVGQQIAGEASARAQRAFEQYERTVGSGLQNQIQKLAEQRAELATKLRSGDLSEGAARQILSDIKRIDEENAQLQAQLSRIGQGRISLSEVQPLRPLDGPRGTPSLLRRQEAAFAGIGASPLGTLVSSEAERAAANQERARAEAERNAAFGQGLIDRANRERENTLKLIEQSAAFQERYVRLIAGLGGEIQAVEAVTQLRLRALEALKAQGADLHDIELRRLDVLQQRELELLELQNRRLEQYRDAAGRVFDALTARGGGGTFKDFLVGQLKLQERQIFINASASIFQRVGGVLGQVGAASGLGGLLRGTLFDPSNASPIAKNTTSLDQLRGSVDRLTVTLGGGGVGSITGPGGLPIPVGIGGLGLGIPGLRGAPGGTVGFTGPVGGLSTTGRTAGFLGGLNPLASGGLFAGVRNRPVAVEVRPDGSSALVFPSTSSRVGNIAGSAAVVGVGAQGVVGGIRQGGARGTTSAIAAGLAVASAIPGPQQPFVMAGALIAGFVAQLFGDPKVKRSQEIDRLIESRRYTETPSAQFEFDRSGNLVDTDITGGVRPIVIQVQAMDSKSFIEHREEIADAVRMAMQFGHPINRTAREVTLNR